MNLLIHPSRKKENFRKLVKKVVINKITSLLSREKAEHTKFADVNFHKKGIFKIAK